MTYIKNKNRRTSFQDLETDPSLLSIITEHDLIDDPRILNAFSDCLRMQLDNELFSWGYQQVGPGTTYHLPTALTISLHLSRSQTKTEMFYDPANAIFNLASAILNANLLFLHLCLC